MRRDNDFFDVTLACGDGTQIEAHKVVLSAGSPFFGSLLKMKKGSTPIIYMRGLKSSDLASIVDFLYFGEVNIYQDQLNDFLAIAEELQLKGLVTYDENQQREKLPLESKAKHHVNRNPNKLQYIAPGVDTKVEKSEPNDTHGSQALINEMNNDHTKVVRIAESDDLNQRMSELIEWTGDNWVCTICGKIAANTHHGKKNLRRHTQIHMEGLSYPCNICGKEFRCKTNVDTHISQIHKKKL